MSEISHEQLETIVERFIEHCEKSLNLRTSSAVDIRAFDSDVASVASSLVGRQCALAIKFAQVPMVWDGHIGPLVMRAMIDCHISLRWILADPDKRAREFINYGLGLAKLSVSHYEAAMERDPENTLVAQMIKARKSWIGSQALMPFVEVNVGSWHGSSVRKMCEELGDLDFYRYSYFPFSSCAHSTWDHVSIYNAKRCQNPMHKFHYVGKFEETPMLFDMLHNAAKYYSMSLETFDVFYDFNSELISPLRFFVDTVEDIAGEAGTAEENPGT